VVQLAAYILAAYTRAPALAFRGGALAAAVVTLHACLLAAPSERAAARRTGRPPGEPGDGNSANECRTYSG
jgi:multisubunit Na+/H+ antiporter MnhB subunit